MNVAFKTQLTDAWLYVYVTEAKESRYVVVWCIKEIIKRVKVARRLPFTFEKVNEKDLKSLFHLLQNFYVDTTYYLGVC